MNEAELTLVLRAKELASRQVDRLSGSLDRAKGAGGRLGGVLATLGKVGVLGLAGIGIAAVGLGPEIMGLAGKLELMDKKAATVFGDQRGSVTAWADANAEAMGLTSRQAEGLAANFGDLLVPMGFTRKQAAAMSTDVVGLSGALSQWTGGTKSAAEVSEILAKAMLGERDGLKSLGISITEADVSARLLANGQDKLTGAALQQAKATATQQLIMEKSKDAQDAYAKSSGTLLGQQARLGAKFEQVKETVVAGLTPVLSKLMTFVMDKAVPAIAKIVGKVQGWMDANRPLIRQIANLVGGVLAELFGALGTLVGWIASVVGAIAKNRDAMNVLRTVFEAIATAVGLAWSAIKILIGVVADVVGVISRNKGIVAGFARVWDTVAGAIKGVVGWIRDVISFGKRAIDVLAHLNPFGGGGGGGSGSPFRAHAEGGWVGLNGPEVGIVGEHGPEYITPAHAAGGRGGGGGGSRVIQLVLDRRVIAQVVDEELGYALQDASLDRR